jgi:hypothetical protein
VTTAQSGAITFWPVGDCTLKNITGTALEVNFEVQHH